MKMRALATTIILAFALCGCSHGSGILHVPDATASSNSSQDVASAIEELSSIEIAEDDGSEYNSDIRKSSYGGWEDVSGWSTRDVVLSQTAEDATKTSSAFTSGVWVSPYTGEEIVCSTKEEVSKNIQIDHIIPIGYVHRHGGASWSDDKKKEYYNDYGTIDANYDSGDNGTVDYPKIGVLVAVDSKSNISKSDKGPSEWMPSDKSYWVEYCIKWVEIADAYDISLSKADYDKIQEVLENA